MSSARSGEVGIAPEMLVPSAEQVSAEADGAAGSRLIQQSTDASEAAARVLAVQEFVANGGGAAVVGAATVLDRRCGRAAAAVSVGVAGGVSERQSHHRRCHVLRLLRVAQTSCLPGVLPSAASGRLRRPESAHVVALLHDRCGRLVVYRWLPLLGDDCLLRVTSQLRH